MIAKLLNALTAPFAVNDHEFHRERVYLSEEAIAGRLDAVAPDWTWELVGDPVTRNGIVSQRGRLTINGVYRDGLGMAAPVMNKAGDSEVNEPEKSAATDAFKRAARMFGVGRYLLSTPDTVRDYASLARWLNGGQSPAPQNGKPAPQQPAPAYAPPPVVADTITFVATRVDEGKSSKGNPFWKFFGDNGINANTFHRPTDDVLSWRKWSVTAVEERAGDKIYYKVVDLQPVGAKEAF